MTYVSKSFQDKIFIFCMLQVLCTVNSIKKTRGCQLIRVKRYKYFPELRKADYRSKLMTTTVIFIVFSYFILLYYFIMFPLRANLHLRWKKTNKYWFTIQYSIQIWLGCRVPVPVYYTRTKFIGESGKDSQVRKGRGKSGD